MGLAHLFAAGVRANLRSPAMWVASILGAFVSISALTFDVLALEPAPSRIAGVMLGGADLVAGLLCVWLASSEAGSDLASDWTPAVISLRPGPSVLVLSRILVSSFVAALSQIPAVAMVIVLYMHSAGDATLYLLLASVSAVPTLLLGLLGLAAWSSVSALWLGPLPALFVGFLVFSLPRVLGPHAALSVLPLPTSLASSAPVLARQALSALGPVFLALAAGRRLASASR